jgi:glyoxylase-like metal-dependent hydrolase (beta-lactamase superfamily II)
MVEKTTSDIIELRPNIYLIKAEKPGSHIYVIKGNNKNVLIDTGIAMNFPRLKASLQKMNLRPKDVHFIILTHEHFDHIGATMYFFDTAVVAAHRLAANKIELQDEFVTWMKYFNTSRKLFHANIWLEDGTTIDLGNYKLNTIHTPGHTSGCICLYEPRAGLLFTGDTVFAGGTLSEIAVGGNVSDYVNSVRRLSNLKIKQLYPGHGRVSSTPDEDLPKAIVYAQTMLDDCKTFFEAFIKTRKLQDKLGSAFGYWTEAQD